MARGSVRVGLAFRELAESLPQLVWTRTREGRAGYASPQWNLYTCGSGPIPTARGWADHIHSEDRTQATDRMAVGCATGATFEFACRIYRHDGVFRWFEIRVAPLHDADGKIDEWACVATDVHARRALPANHARATEQLAMAEAVAGVGSWSFDLASGVVAWSDELFRITGFEGSVAPDYEQQALIYTPASWAQLTRAVTHSVATGDGYELELELIRPDGTRRWTTARAQTQRDEDGKVLQLIGTLQDVTELKLAVRARDQAIERMRLATSTSKVGIWDWDIAANCMVWDETMYALYGIDASSRANSYELWRAGLHPDDAAAAESSVRLAIAGDEPFDTAFRVIHPDGQVRYLRGLGTVQRDASGGATRMTGVNWDETALKTAELAQREQTAMTALLQNVATSANRAWSADEAYREILRSVCTYMNWPVGHVYIAEGSELVPTDIWHLDDPAALAPFREATRISRFGPAVGLPGVALARGEASCIEDVARSPDFPRAAAAAAARLVTGFAFPVLVGTEVAAVLEFYLRERASFDPKLLSVMASVGELLGSVVARERLKSAVAALSVRDELTGLLNRRGLLAQGASVYQRALLGGSGLAAVFCDLNGMKNVNDELGHAVGDLAIRDGADVLRSTLTPGDLIGRLGGDEFVVLTVNGDVDRAAVLEARVRSAVAAFNARGLRPYQLSISLGSAALDVGSPVPLEDLFAQADARMYEQKRERRSSGLMTIPVPPLPMRRKSDQRGVSLKT